MGAGASAGVESWDGVTSQLHFLSKLVGQQAGRASGGRFQRESVIRRLVQRAQIGVELEGQVSAYRVGKSELPAAKVYVFAGGRETVEPPYRLGQAVTIYAQFLGKSFDGFIADQPIGNVLAGLDAAQSIVV